MSEIAERQDSLPSTPGMGTSGIVMCPLMRGPCLKSACEFWIELKFGDRYVGRCANAYGAIIMVELRQEIERLRLAMAKPIIVDPRKKGK